MSEEKKCTNATSSSIEKESAEFSDDILKVEDNAVIDVMENLGNLSHDKDLFLKDTSDVLLEDLLKNEKDYLPTEEKSSLEGTKVEALRLENEDMHNRLVRMAADIENLRRRSEQRCEDASRYAIVEFAREMLGVLDNLSRALGSVERNKDSNNTGEISVTKERFFSLVEGVEMTARLMRQSLERFGVEKISSLGEAFDHNRHEAMLEVENKDYPPGTVVQVIEEGYMIRDRLLRPARVAVSKKNQG